MPLRFLRAETQAQVQRAALNEVPGKRQSSTRMYDSLGDACSAAGDRDSTERLKELNDPSDSSDSWQGIPFPSAKPRAARDTFCRSYNSGQGSTENRRFLRVPNARMVEGYNPRVQKDDVGLPSKPAIVCAGFFFLGPNHYEGLSPLGLSS